MSDNKAEAKQPGSMQPGMYVSCRVGELLLGIDIAHIQEINRMVDATFVPRLPEQVRGVINLRGSLVSVLDLGRILVGSTTASGSTARNVILDLGEERVGLIVDTVGDVIDCSERTIERLPSHVERQHGRWFRGLVQLERELLLILDVQAVSKPPSEEPAEVATTQGAGA